MKHILPVAQEFFFYDRETEEDIDVLHFIQLVAKKIPSKPYVIDFEHIAGLANFVKLDRAAERKTFNFLSDYRCYGIVPITYAARKSFEDLFPDLYREVAYKTEVVYPALPDYYTLLKDAIDYTCVVPRRDTFKLLFVGNDVYRKGLHELLSAFKKLEDKYHDLELYVISDAPPRLKRAYPSERIRYFDPVFSRTDILKKFYMPCDLFVMPTHCDTFGMALLDSLACGTPVVTTEQFAASEIIKPGINGLFVRSNRLLLNDIPFPSRRATMSYITDTVETLLVNDLVEKIEYLYLRRDLLSRMGMEAIKDFEPTSKFSIDVRNKKLGKLYKSCRTRKGNN
ncbi:MAG: glycosyltransferase family 4 protein [Syntrophales bacterium]|nr:glycosyltransferase family 4 protein [Syntrophales bacterium]